MMIDKGGWWRGCAHGQDKHGQWTLDTLAPARCSVSVLEWSQCLLRQAANLATALLCALQ